MKANQQYQLKRDEVIRLLGKHELKKWWVAEMSGVHKTTLRRWLQGKTRHIRYNHAEKLARTLQANLSEITELRAVKTKENNGLGR